MYNMKIKILGQASELKQTAISTDLLNLGRGVMAEVVADKYDCPGECRVTPRMEL